MADIFNIIKKIEDIYNNNKRDSDAEQLLMKLALLEACGWIENTIDYICGRTSKNDPLLQKEIDEYLDKCYSFSYEKFKGCLCFCVGITTFNAIEQTFTPQELSNFRSALNTLKKKRDSAAHNPIYALPNLIGFTDVNSHLKTIISGFQKINKYLRNNNLI